MDELAKVRRVIAKQIPDAPHETLISIDATTGQNGLRQAKVFSEAVELDGVVLTKLDGTAKGGIALAIADELGIPVKLIGIGETLEDLRPFDPAEFAQALLAEFRPLTGPARRVASAAVFDQLSDRLQATLSDVRSRGKLSEADVDAAMREIRLALLEADVNFKVVKAFTATLKERCLGSEVLESLDPGQQVVKIVNEELTALMGGTGRELAFASSGPTVILMAGLQGSGKTTACAKLARHLGEAGKDVALAACDVYRPAAVDQLVTVGERAGAHVYQQGTDRDPVEIAEWALAQARDEDRDVLIVDTAGRLHIDEDLMAELARIRKRTKPHDVLLVVDAMTGQDAVGVAESVRRGGRVRRRRDDQARRRRPRRRRALGQGGHRQADPLRLDRREAGGLRPLPPRPHGLAHPRHGRRPHPDRESRAAGRREAGARPAGETEGATSSRSRTSSSRCARCAKWARSAA